MLQDGDGVQGVWPPVVVVGPDTIRIACGRAPGRNVASVSAPMVATSIAMVAVEVEPDLPSAGIQRVVHDCCDVLLVELEVRLRVRRDAPVHLQIVHVPAGDGARVLVVVLPVARYRGVLPIDPRAVARVVAAVGAGAEAARGVCTQEASRRADAGAQGVADGGEWGDVHSPNLKWRSCSQPVSSSMPAGNRLGSGCSWPSAVRLGWIQQSSRLT